jgi:uncharacterized membrane protein (DUF2068 family)
MADLPKIPDSKPKRAPTLYIISALKIVKGVLLLAAALGIYSLANKDLPFLFDEFLRWIHVDPERKFFSDIGDRLDTITPANVRWVATGTFLYGLFLITGGTGLAYRARWAVWLSIGESAFFVPIEIFELLRPERFSWELVAVLVFNVVIVWYLFRNRERLFRHPHHPPEEPAMPSPQTGSS